MSLKAFSEDIHSFFVCLCFAYIEEYMIRKRLQWKRIHVKGGLNSVNK